VPKRSFIAGPPAKQSAAERTLPVADVQSKRLGKGEETPAEGPKKAYREQKMDDKTRELIAVGASVTAHCQPCVTYHIGKAREMGIDDQEIREAVAVGHKVEKGSMSAMRDFTERSLNSPTQDNQDNSACCADSSSPGGKSCCSQKPNKEK
jgi:AhpD family alkylhydroperoxidase